MDKKRMTFLAMLLLALSVLALVAACGGGDDDDDNTGDDAAASESADSGDVASDDAEDPTDAPEATDPPDDGGNDGGGSSGGDVDSCSALTQEQVEAALGVSVQAPVETYSSQAGLPNGDMADVGTCNYVSPEGFDSISVSMWSGPQAGVEALTEAACAGKEEIDAGDDGCWYDDGHAEIQIRVGDVYLDIFATVTTAGDSTAVLEQLAANAAANLG